MDQRLVESSKSTSSPGDSEILQLQGSYRQLSQDIFFSSVMPNPLPEPQLISCNSVLAYRLGIPSDVLQPDKLARLTAGADLFQGSQPLAMKYTGHQFGVYNPQLGDGRGLLLGEYLAPDGTLYDLHLKGAGKTPYSRFGDGRLVLRSAVREYLASAAMKALGIPTTEALSLVVSEQMALRDGFYEPCAALLRVTPCHIRFGHFEYLYHSRRFDALRQLTNYIIQRYFPQFMSTDHPPLTLIRAIIRRSASLVADWQAYGFIHGVMNTDNMSILGETFDYGPFQFMDIYRSKQVSNHTDHQGRYAFNRQPDVMRWNLFRLAQCFMPLLGTSIGNTAQQLLEQELDSFYGLYQAAYLQRMQQRLGLEAQLNNTEQEMQLIQDLWRLLEVQSFDLTQFFRMLSETPTEQQMSALEQLARPPASNAGAFALWFMTYHQRLKQNSASEPERLQQMQQVNPIYILRNAHVQQVIAALYEGDKKPLQHLLFALQNPFTRLADDTELYQASPDGAQNLCLSCSS